MSENVLSKLTPNFEEMDKVSREHGAIGMHVYYLNPKPGITASVRNFSPVVGINEESATGTSAGALSCLLF